MKFRVTSSHVLKPGVVANVGDEIDLPEKEAARKVRLGYIEPLSPQPTPPGQMTIRDPEGQHRDPAPGGKGKKGEKPGGSEE